MSEDDKIKTIEDVEEALNSVITHDGEPMSEHDREVVKQYLIDTYLK
ncbi:hypothetical protein P7H62_06215 [Vagococcus carniphilus]|nr:hypothetical protein [Vagococcus carniphilus]MDT2830875.1 hypothetical protein [Vagococcus carniphilus]MDT2854038.1 hypothetical protein [Vagococcus carniphilus]